MPNGRLHKKRFKSRWSLYFLYFWLGFWIMHSVESLVWLLVVLFITGITMEIIDAIQLEEERRRSE